MSNIKIMTNMRLWLLTGRSNNFANAALNTGIHYRGSEPPSEIVLARSVIRLDDTRTDFYVMGAAASAMASSPLLRGLPADKDLCFAHDLVRLAPVGIAGADLVAIDSQRIPIIDGSPAGKSGFTKVTFKKAGSACEVSRDDGFSAYVPFTHSGNILRINGCEDHGIKANFFVPAWDDGDTITVTIAPTNYPYGEMGRSIAEQPKLARLMSEEGTMEAFASSVYDIHRVGALAAAIMLRMTKLTEEFGLEYAIAPDSATAYHSGAVTLDWSPLTLDTKPITYNP